MKSLSMKSLSLKLKDLLNYRRVFLVFLMLAILISSSDLALAVPYTPTIRATIAAPTAKSIRIVHWSPRMLNLAANALFFARVREEDLTLPSPPYTGLEPGENSWDLLPYPVPAGNVGFTAICLTDHPATTKLKVSIDPANLRNLFFPTYTIDPIGPDGTTVYFGYTVQQRGTYVVGSGTSSVPLSGAGTATEVLFYPTPSGYYYYGCDFKINLTLKVPPNTRPGLYITTLKVDLYE